MNALILYSTVDGHTQSICTYLQNQLQQATTHATKTVDSTGDLTVDVLPLDEFCAQPNVADSLSEYDLLILGASIRYGKHRPNVTKFVETYRSQLADLKVGFFSVNLVARKPEKNRASTNPYVLKFLEQTNWQPDVVDVFAGKLDYARYGVLDKTMIRFIMWVTKGPTHSDKPIVFTDYERVDAFCEQVLQQSVAK